MNATIHIIPILPPRWTCQEEVALTMTRGEAETLYCALEIAFHAMPRADIDMRKWCAAARRSAACCRSRGRHWA